MEGQSQNLGYDSIKMKLCKASCKAEYNASRSVLLRKNMLRLPVKKE